MAQERYCVDRQSIAQVGTALGIAASTVRRWVERHGWEREREAIAAAEVEIRANTVKARAFVLKKLLEAQNGAEAAQAAVAVAALERMIVERLAAARHDECRAAGPDGGSMKKTAGPKNHEPGKPARRAARGACAKEAAQPGALCPVAPDATGWSAPPPAATTAGNGMPEEIASVAKNLSDEERVRLLEEAVNRQLAFVLAHPVEDLAKRIKEIKAALDVLSSIRGRDAGEAGIIVSFAEEGE